MVSHGEKSYHLHLFLIFINELIHEFPKGMKVALYADDPVMWCKEEYATTSTFRMRIAADKLTV